MQLLRCREGNLIFRAKESEGALPDLKVLEGKGQIVTAQVEAPRSPVLEMFQHRNETK